VRSSSAKRPAGPEFADTGWQAQQADALVAIAQAFLAGGEQGKPAAPDHYQVVVHVDADALGGACATAADRPGTASSEGLQAAPTTTQGRVRQRRCEADRLV
jgi:hypothetical protein